MKQSDLYERKLVPITLFNKGKASQIFESVKAEKNLFVLKNNRAVAIVLAPEEYSSMCSIAEFCTDLLKSDNLTETQRTALQGLLQKSSLINGI